MRCGEHEPATALNSWRHGSYAINLSEHSPPVVRWPEKTNLHPISTASIQ
jgi:hypothetical protein